MKKWVSSAAIAAYLALCQIPAIAHVYEPHQLTQVKHPCAPLQAGMFTGIIGFNAYTQIVSIVLSTQPFSITIPNTSTSQAQTITAVTPGTASIFYNGQSTNDTSASGANPDTSMGMVVLTNGTTVTASKNTNTTFGCTVNGFVVDWNPNFVLSVQRGTVTIAAAATTQTASITAIVTGDSAVMFLGFQCTYNSSAAGNCFCMVQLTATNQITATRGLTTLATTLSYEVTSFFPGMLQRSTQQVSVTLTASASGTTGISASDPNYTLNWFGGQSSNWSNNDTSKRAYCFFDNGFLNATRTSSTENVTISGTAVLFQQVHFAYPVVKSGITIASGNTTVDDASASAIIGAKSFLTYGGLDNSTTSVVNNVTEPALSFNGTNVRSTRNASLASSVYSYYECCTPN